MPMLNSIGNDVVDLGVMQAPGAFQHRRFFERAFTQAEQREILESARPEIALWVAWSAKEAAYKALRKGQPHLVFSPRMFQVQQITPGHGQSMAWVTYVKTRVPCRCTCTDAYVHALCSWNGSDFTEEIPAEVVSTVRERSRVMSESRAARALAQELAFVHYHTKGAVVRNREMPPQWHSPEGMPCLDVSLSHDGRFVAAALVRSR